jgi:hypothetical protein
VSDKKEDSGSWYSKASSMFTDVVDSDAGAALLGTGIAAVGQAFAPDFFNPQSAPVGYQGEIPKYEAVRERVQLPQDPNRRPGGAGRRYFSDTIYAKKPESEPMSVAQARAKAKEQAQGLAALQAPKNMAGGGILAMSKGRYLNGSTDGMADKVPARIDSGQEARLSDGEFVIPADVVSHLGNGNSDAGAKALHAMMDRVRKERTGNKKQGKEITATKMLPA